MAIVRRCIICKKTQGDHRREGREWAEENNAPAYGVPGVKIRCGAPICDFCAHNIAEEFLRKPKPVENKRPAITPEQRWEVWERDNYTCRRCRSRRNLTVDHVKPLCLGGAHETANMQTLCKSCNSWKGGRLVEVKGAKNG